MEKKRYYVDKNKKYQQVVEGWNNCVRLNKTYGGLSFTGFTSLAEAQRYLDALESKEEERERKRKELFAGCGIIGSDEVGKVEPFRQVVVVAVYADPDVVRSQENGNFLETKDSKELTREDIRRIGGELTGFHTFDEIDGRVYANEKYGLLYSIDFITNEKYNAWTDQEGAKDLSLVAQAHNNVLTRVYEAVRAQGKKLSHFAIDDFINQKETTQDRFRKYLRAVDAQVPCVLDLDDVETVMLTHSESDLWETIGAASVIGSFVDQLWQRRVTEIFRKDGIEFQEDWFGNFAGQEDINRVFALIEQKYEDIDRSPVAIKHTKYYKTWKNRR